MARPLISSPPIDAAAAEALAFAEAALGVAGHEVTDPVLVSLLERKARGELTADQFIMAARNHVQG